MDVQGPAGFSGRAHGAASSSGATGGGSGANAHTANTASGTFYDARMHAGPSHPSNHDPRAPHTSPPPSPRTSPLRGAMSPPVLPSASSYDSWFSPRAGRTVAYSDRFIPSRAQSARVDYSLLDREMATSEVQRQAAEREDINPNYNTLLRTHLLGWEGPPPMSPEKAAGGSASYGPAGSSGQVPGTPRSNKILRFKAGDATSPLAGPAPPSPFSASPIGVDNPLSSPIASPKKVPRRIGRAPYKVLDAPALADDFYLNLVDWSAQSVVAVGLGTCVYLWSATTSRVTKLCDLRPQEDTICSVSWSNRGTYLAIGTNKGDVQIWDPTKLRPIRTMHGHQARVGCMDWGSHLLSTGSRDRTILQRDVRSPDHFQSKLAGHRSELCGLRWAPDRSQLASGGNDNQLLVWSPQATSPVLRFSDHTAAVKAIAWSPHQHGLLVSGGGTADRHIRFWNTSTGSALNAVDTGSQVCNIAWSKNANEIVSTHGYSQNQIVVWRYPSMAKLATLTGHTYRVLYLATSPDGQTIVTGAGDETLRFWSVFPGAKSAATGDASVVNMLRTQIR